MYDQIKDTAEAALQKAKETAGDVTTAVGNAMESAGETGRKQAVAAEKVVVRAAKSTRKAMGRAVKRARRAGARAAKSAKRTARKLASRARGLAPARRRKVRPEGPEGEGPRQGPQGPGPGQGPQGPDAPEGQEGRPPSSLRAAVAYRSVGSPGGGDLGG